MATQALRKVSRRDFLKLMGVAAAATEMSACNALSSNFYSFGRGELPESLKIDTHQHYIPPNYAKWLDSQGFNPSGMAMPLWEKAAAVEMMDKHGIQVGILSIAPPGVHLGDDHAARTMAREVNEFAAEIVATGAGRFGFFATLTLPDVEGAINELNYAMDHLHADGVILLANVGGIYLGDKLFDPLLVELNRRGSVVFIHPGYLPGPEVPGVPPFVADFLLDTTRAVAKLYISAALIKYPYIKFILAHGGGFVPYAAQRLLFRRLQYGGPAALNPKKFLETELAVFRKFYFDTALSTGSTTLPSLLSLADADHITYGSDWPFAPEPLVSAFDSMLESYPLGDEQRAAINHGTAGKLFAGLALGRP
jgi:predicted TIM-barrel fold metal-dependent hydrolase